VRVFHILGDSRYSGRLSPESLSTYARRSSRIGGLAQVVDPGDLHQGSFRCMLFHSIPGRGPGAGMGKQRRLHPLPQPSAPAAGRLPQQHICSCVCCGFVTLYNCITLDAEVMCGCSREWVLRICEDVCQYDIHPSIILGELSYLLWVRGLGPVRTQIQLTRQGVPLL